MREVFFYELIELVLGLVFATHVAWARWQNRGSNGKIGITPFPLSVSGSVTESPVSSMRTNKSKNSLIHL